MSVSVTVEAGFGCLHQKSKTQLARSMFSSRGPDERHYTVECVSLDLLSSDPSVSWESLSES